jgi:hypothetical protein
LHLAEEDEFLSESAQAQIKSALAGKARPSTAISEDYHNYHRPHGALDGQTPYERLLVRVAITFVS